MQARSPTHAQPPTQGRTTKALKWWPAGWPKPSGGWVRGGGTKGAGPHKQLDLSRAKKRENKKRRGEATHRTLLHIRPRVQRWQHLHDHPALAIAGAACKQLGPATTRRQGNLCVGMGNIAGRGHMWTCAWAPSCFSLGPALHRPQALARQANGGAPHTLQGPHAPCVQLLRRDDRGQRAWRALLATVVVWSGVIDTPRVAAVQGHCRPCRAHPQATALPLTLSQFRAGKAGGASPFVCPRTSIS